MMPTPLVGLLAACAVTALAGCASMSPEECLVANWRERGHQDGRDGTAPTRIAEHRKACADVGVVPDAALYRRGWDRGVREYCTPANGLARGRNGEPYRNVCPPDLEDLFVHWHQLGTDVHRAQRRVDDLDRQLTQARHRLDEEDDSTRRRNMQRRLRALSNELRDARQDLARAEQRLP